LQKFTEVVTKFLVFIDVNPVVVVKNAVAVTMIVIVAFLVHKALVKLFGKFEQFLVDGKIKSHRPAQAQRTKTVMGLIRQVEVVCLTLFTIILVLDQLGLNVRPVLAGAGVVGLAVGFGAQSLVKDFFSGMCLILENQMTVGDWVVINGHSGTVETLNFRITVLRDSEGAVHVIPNGCITSITNCTHTWSATVLDIPLPEGQTIEQTTEILTAIAAEMRAEEKWSTILLEDIEMMGVQDMTDRGIVVRARIKTQPGSQWSVGRDFRRRLSQRWEALGVQSPRTTQNLLVMTKNESL
jgi:moderate conductance mechanosensitive channel